MAEQLLYFYAVEQNQRINRRVLRHRNNPLDFMSDDEIRSKYRLPRQCILDLCTTLNRSLQHPTRRSNALPVSLQLALSLRYFATGNFQAVNADIHGISKSTVSRCVHAVASALCEHVNYYIKFPTSPVDIQQTKMAFYEIANFPNVLGTIDGTLIPIKAPSIDERLYVCRKGFHALNVQCIATASLKFSNVVAKWPGNTHDAFIWSNSAICADFENEVITGGYLLGDSAYPLQPYLLTPLADPINGAERQYNRAHKRTRCISERAYGVWKSRFRCLHKSGGCMMFKPERCVKVIVCTAILHNICIDNGIPLDIELEDVHDQNDDVVVDVANDVLQDINGRAVRQNVIDNHFS